jgi:sugar lactone lactonase YvrE
MRTPPSLPRIARLITTSGLALAALAGGAMPATASAAEQYELRDYGTKCVSGQTDERQYTYTVCQSAANEGYLRVDDPAGNRVSYVRMPGANDVAPSPDGSVVYVSGGDTGVVRKFVRQGNTYVRDASFRPTFKQWGVTYNADGHQIATDGYGNLYIANGVWMDPSPNMVTKYGPDGKLIAQFGDYTNTWAAGLFFNLSGIAVSRDGKHIYTTEVQNGRVQRFDERQDGQYQWALSFGNDQVNDPGRTGRNCVVGSLSAPYDVAVDAWGDVWTTSTSCTRITKWSPNGQVLFSSFAGNRGPNLPGGPTATDTQQRSHWLAVTARGDVIVGETSNVLVRQGAIPAWPALDAQHDPVPVPDPDPQPDPQPDPDPDPAPQPNPGAVDRTAPVVDAVTIPATTTSRAVDVAIDARDDVAVTQLRLATEDGNWGAWQAFASPARFTLTAGLGFRGVYVQVRDAAGRESNIVYRTTRLLGNEPAPDPAPQPQPQPDPDPAPNPQPAHDAAAPTLRDVIVPATSATSAIDLRIDATDDVGVTQMRLATDDGNWGAWKAFSATTAFTLRAGHGYRGVYVQVRDAAGRESAALYRRVTVA